MEATSYVSHTSCSEEVQVNHLKNISLYFLAKDWVFYSICKQIHFSVAHAAYIFHHERKTLEISYDFLTHTNSYTLNTLDLGIWMGH